MPTRERPIDRGSVRARRILADLGREIRDARRDRGLSQKAVGQAAGMSASKVSRIERGLAPRATVVDLSRLLGVVGLELSARAFPGGLPIRDEGQAKVLSRFRAVLHRSIGWSVEVPMPIPGDQRAWDAVIRGAPMAGAPAWRFGVEVETAPRDVQALLRRIALKVRDGGVDGVILVLPATRRTRDVIRAAGASLAADFLVPGARALELLAAGVSPGGNAVVVI